MQRDRAKQNIGKRFMQTVLALHRRAGIDETANRPEQRDDGYATERIVADRSLRYPTKQAANMMLDLTGLQEIGEARMSATDETPDEAERDQHGCNPSRRDMPRRKQALLSGR